MRTKAVFDNIAEHLEEQIDLAENKIVVAVAWFTNKRLFDALCKKAANGVKVKLIIDDNEINRNSTINHSDIQIGKSKLYWIETHNKFCIIDDYIVITGSYNWSYRAESNSENILICTGDNDLVKQYKNEVKKIIKDYLPENDIKPKSRWEEAIKSGRIKPYVPPGLKLKGFDTPTLRPSTKNLFESTGIKPYVPPGLKLKDYNTPTERPSTKNDFESIKIGDQEWMLKNLDVDRFRNGDRIPAFNDRDNWRKAGISGTPACCYYDNNPENGKMYGRLYNWFAVNDKRGLAPDGWHVPSDGEWTILEKFLGEDYAGHKMKSVGSDYWVEQNVKFMNSSGFSALPGGYRNWDGGFYAIRFNTYFWSATEHDGDSKYTWIRNLFAPDGGMYRKYNQKNWGYSVRCLRDCLFDSLLARLAGGQRSKNSQ